MSTLETWILGVLLHIAPSDATRRVVESEEETKTRYQAIAADMAAVVQESKPLFGNDTNRVQTAALMIAIAQFESGGFTKQVDNGTKLGDHGKSWCLMQVQVGERGVAVNGETWKGQDLVDDRKKCFKAGLQALRVSMSYCGKTTREQDPSSRLNLYVRGPKGLDCATSKHAQHRWDLAKRIRAKFPLVIEEPTSGT